MDKNSIFFETGTKYIFDARLAKKIGLNNAIVFGNLVCQINDSRSDARIFKNGKYWIVRSYKNWHEEIFPFFSECTLKRTFLNLEKIGAIESFKPYKTDFNATKAYTIKYEFADDILKGGFKIWLN